MGFLLELNSVFLISLGFMIGIFSVVIGGGMFFSIPLIQLLFLQISFGAVIGNLKTGSFFRGIGSTGSTLKKINWKHGLFLSIPLLVGTILGVSIIAKLDQRWVFPALIVAVVISELAPWISKRIKNEHFIAAAVFIGAYAGFLGAGVGVILIALLRLKTAADKKIAHVKIQARFIEFTTVIVAVITHYFHGNLIVSVWLPWSVGSVFGGLIGGVILKRVGKLSGKIQKLILRLAFAFALMVAGAKFFS